MRTGVFVEVNTPVLITTAVYQRKAAAAAYY